MSATGVGISPEDQATIFEEFRQVGGDNAQKSEGTGLGLTLAKKFVELHGGKDLGRNEVGKGGKAPYRYQRTDSCMVLMGEWRTKCPDDLSR